MSNACLLHRIDRTYADVCAGLHCEGFAAQEQWDAAAFLSLLDVEGTAGWVATINDRPVGLILVRACLDEAEILTLMVSADFRRCGIAVRMFEAALTWLGGARVRTLFLEVSQHNGPALALYRRLGFQDCGVRRQYYHDGSDAIVMRHDLQNESL